MADGNGVKHTNGNGHTTHLKFISILLGVVVALLVIWNALSKSASMTTTQALEIKQLQKDVEFFRTEAASHRGTISERLDKLEVRLEKVQDKNEFRLTLLEKRIGAK